MKLVFKIMTGSLTFHGIDYNEKKKEQGSAELLHINNFGHVQDGRELISKSELKTYLEQYSNRNTKVKKPQFHAILSCKGDEFTYAQLQANALDIMHKLGYEGNPIIIYGHNDTSNRHIHIITSRVGQDGKKIAHDLEGKKANAILNKILKYDTVADFKKVLTNALLYNFSTRAQFILLIENKGYSYKEKDSVINFYKHGKLQGSLTDQEINDKIQQNKVLIKNPNQLKALIHKYSNIYSTGLSISPLLPYTTGLPKFESPLTNFLKEKFGYDFVFFTGKGESNPYGYAIVDNNNKSVYKGSEVMKINELLTLSGKKGLSAVINLKQRRTNDNVTIKSNNDISSYTDTSNKSDKTGIILDTIMESLGLLVSDLDIKSSGGQSPSKKKKKKNQYF